MDNFSKEDGLMKKRLLALFAIVCLIATSLTMVMPAVADTADPVQLKAIVSNHTITKDLNEFEWLQAMEDAAGVDVEWQCIWSDWDTLKSTLFASMDLPDFFFCGGTLSLSDVINNQELFVALNDYIDNSTNLAPLYESDPYMGQKTILEDGSIYSLTNRLPCRPYTDTGAFINQTWLDALELEMPTTLDELLEVLIAMKEGDPNGNGLADEIPWVGASGATDWLMGTFGVAASRYSLMYDDNGDLQYVYTTEAYKQAIEFEAKAYAAGVIDPEIFTQDWSVAYALAQEETPVVGLCTAWTISAICGPVNKVHYTTMPILKASEDSDIEVKWPGHPAYLVYNHDVVFAMTIACAEENRQPLFNFIDSLYTNENSLRQWGGDGVIFNDDGTVDVTVAVEGMSLDDYQWTYAYNDKMVGYVTPEYEANINMNEEQLEKFEIDAVYRDYIPEAVPLVILSSADSQELSIVQTDMDNIRKQYRSEWVTGTLDVESTWDQYLADMAAAGVDTYVEIYTNTINK